MAASVANTHRHMAWQEVRAAALKQVKVRKTDSPEAQKVLDWKMRWKVTAAERTSSPRTGHVVTINLGPRGFQACIEGLPGVVEQHDTQPVVIHLQDVRITKRRLRTIHDFAKRILPDYTMYAQLKQCTAARRYNMGVISLVRNDAAHDATQVSVSQFLDQDAEHHEDVADTVEQCTGRVLVIKTSPPGAPGEVWHVNIYQHTANALARS